MTECCFLAVRASAGFGGVGLKPGAFVTVRTLASMADTSFTALLLRSAQRVPSFGLKI
jgi:hypothetical protein